MREQHQSCLARITYLNSRIPERLAPTVPPILKLKEKNSPKYRKVSKTIGLIKVLIIVEEKTIIFDFDETLAKVVFVKDALPNYDEQIDMLTRK